MKLIRAIGMNGGYATFEIEGGDNNESIGDQVWFSGCGTKLEICECVSGNMLREVAKLFDQPKALIGAFNRMTQI